MTASGNLEHTAQAKLNISDGPLRATGETMSNKIENPVVIGGMQWEHSTPNCQHYLSLPHGR
ncbi:hypothetical protein KCP74_15180 [Salmonella enterica subsp. enterica]|nr:hypothetical protein KCP74_15180 [Salmonella enterica subsp. enterica]